MPRKRIERDFYPSPDRLIRAYFATNAKYIALGQTILEPCAGNGAIVNPLRELGYKVEGTDITPKSIGS